MLLESIAGMFETPNYCDEGEGGGAPPAPTPAPAPVAKTYSEAEFNALQSRLSTLETDHSAAQTKLTAFEQSQLTETQKIEAKAAEAETKREAAETKAKASQYRVVKAEFKVAAKDAGIVDADLALLAIKDKIEFDGDGEPTNITVLLEQLVKDKPYLVGTGGGAGIGLTPGAQRQGNGGTPTAFDKINEDFSKTRGSSSSFRIG